MPNLYKYFGIVISFFSDEHFPIHVHCTYQGKVVKVSFYLKDGKITKTIYQKIDEDFPENKMKELKKFINIFDYKIIDAWANYFVYGKKTNCLTITRKI